MSDILTLTRHCGGLNCGATVEAPEAIELVEPPPRDFVEHDHGHMQLNYARGLLENLNAAALAAGWRWDGSEWRCKACSRMSIEMGRYWASQAAEVVAHALDV